MEKLIVYEAPQADIVSVNLESLLATSAPDYNKGWDYDLDED